MFASPLARGVESGNNWDHGLRFNADALGYPRLHASTTVAPPLHREGLPDGLRGFVRPTCVRSDKYR
ncbi:hypothetical protein N9L68_00855 [bacterium]|nr:hypothetical protein [bacterium]